MLFLSHSLSSRKADISLYLYREKVNIFFFTIMTKPFIIQDQYFEKAKKMGYRARSAFKLLEIQEKFSVIKPHMNVLDVAAAPGSFLQVIAKII